VLKLEFSQGGVARFETGVAGFEKVLLLFVVVSMCRAGCRIFFQFVNSPKLECSQRSLHFPEEFVVPFYGSDSTQDEAIVKAYGTHRKPTKPT
jgi:hypothetical protein